MGDASGIFPPSPARFGPPRAALTTGRVRRLLRTEIRWTDDLDAQLMDHIADGKSFIATAELMGLSKDQTGSRFAALRRKMGWQAT